MSAKTSAKMRAPKIRLNSWLLPVLVFAAMITDLVAPYRGWRILYVGIGGALILGYFWVRSLARGLDLTREMRFGWAQVGDRLVERFTLRNEGWAPGVWVCLRRNGFCHLDHHSRRDRVSHKAIVQSALREVSLRCEVDG